MIQNITLGETKFSIKDIMEAATNLEKLNSECNLEIEKMAREYACRFFIEKPSIFNFYKKPLTPDEAFEFFRNACKISYSFRQSLYRNHKEYIIKCDERKLYTDDMDSFILLIDLFKNSEKVYLSKQDNSLIVKYLQTSKGVN